MKSSVLLLAVLTFSSACSRIEKAESNMKALKQRTTDMALTTQDMKDTTSSMYQQVRSKEAEATRSEKFKVLMSDEEGFGAKLAASAIYFKSFEFQLWTGVQSYDNAHARDMLFLDAANEFTKRMADLYDQKKMKKMSPTDEGKKHSKEQSFYALAATMHMNHHYQEELFDSSASKKATSFYDLMKEALRKDANRQTLTDYQEVLVSGMNKEIMIELIKARVDMMSALALKNLTDKRNMTLSQKLKAGLFKLTKGSFGSIELPETFSKANESTKIQTLKYLDAAKKAKDFLDEIQVPKNLERTLQAAFERIELDEGAHDDGVPELEESTEEANSRKMQIRDLITALITVS